MTNNRSIIQEQSDLDRVVAELDDIVGIDTEFHRRRTFFPKPCVLQLATPKNAYIVDLLAPLNLKELESRLFDESLVKVAHSPREDLELFYLIFGAQLPNLIDVQLAHSFVSTDSALNYSALVAHYLGIPVARNKSLTQSDWRTRPLAAAQLDYALDDVRYLLPLWERIRNRLNSLNRLSWFLEEVRYFFRPVYEFTLTDIASIPTKDSWEQIEMQVYFGLLEWRERTARSRNIPRERVLSNTSVKLMVENHNRDFRFFKEHFRGTGSKFHRLILKIKNGTNRQKNFCVHNDSLTTADSPEVILRAKEPIKRLLTQKSESLVLASETLGRNYQISNWISCYHQHQEFPQSFGMWREAIFGNELREILNT